MRELFRWPIDLFLFAWEILGAILGDALNGLVWTFRLSGSAVLSLANLFTTFIRSEKTDDDILFCVYILVLGLFMVSAILAAPASLVQGLCFIEVAITFALLACATMRRISKKS